MNEFQVQVAYKDGVLKRLTSLVHLFENRPVTVTPELLEWADGHRAFADW